MNCCSVIASPPTAPWVRKYFTWRLYKFMRTTSLAVIVIKQQRIGRGWVKFDRRSRAPLYAPGQLLDFVTTNLLKICAVNNLLFVRK